MHSFSVYDMYQRNARLYKDGTAVVTDGLRLSFEELLRDSNVFAAALVGMGIERGDRVAVLAMNDHRFFTVFGAVAAIGAIVVPLNRRLSDEEAAFILVDSGARVLISDGNHAEKAEALAGMVGGIKTICWSPPDGRYPGMDTMAKDVLLVETSLSEDDPFCLLYTAAVDGRPRGAVLSHGNIIFSNMEMAATMGLSSRDAYLNMLPISRMTGINLSLSVMHVGGKNVIIEKFDENRVLAETEREQVSIWGSFPPMLTRLTKAAAKFDGDLSSLRHVMGLDGLDNIRAFEDKTGAVFWILYGQTETSGLVSLSPAMECSGSAGRIGLL